MDFNRIKMICSPAFFNRNFLDGFGYGVTHSFLVRGGIYSAGGLVWLLLRTINGLNWACLICEVSLQLLNLARLRTSLRCLLVLVGLNAIQTPLCSVAAFLVVSMVLTPVILW